MVGAGLVGGAFFLAPTPAGSLVSPDPATTVVVGEAPERSYVEITDSDGDGIADWQEEFRDISNPLVEPTATITPFVPDTLTEQASIQLFEDMMRARMIGGGFAESDESLVERNFQNIAAAAEDTLYTEADITINTGRLNESEERAYFNAVASIIERNAADTRNEALILQEAVNANDPSLLAELAINERVYLNMRDEMLRLSVPAQYSEIHLDLTNAYSAIYNDILAMQDVFDDPLNALVRIKRYEDDAAGLFYAMQNYHLELRDSSIRLNDQDIANIFALFKSQ
ncbi:hypothetical protein N9L26_01970 [Candidatus Pacebacteria bacterium]|nr:hypothetical protein [Candidatus Paceibacterota bacterium]